MARKMLKERPAVILKTKPSNIAGWSIILCLINGPDIPEYVIWNYGPEHERQSGRYFSAAENRAYERALECWEGAR